MFKIFMLILKNLGRNKLRTTLTGLAVAVLVTICTAMIAILSSISRRVSSDAGQAKLIVSERWSIPSLIPLHDVEEISHIAGVQSWATWNFYSGFFDQSQQKSHQGFGIATQVATIPEMVTGLQDLDPALVKALEKDKTGALMGAQVMELMGWQVGQQFTFISSSHPGKNLQFKIVGVLPPGEFPKNFFFRYDYFAEGTGSKETVDCMWLRAPSPDAAQELANVIQHQRGQRQPELKVETESASVARFANRGEAILGLIQLVVLVLLIDMVVVLSNSISVAIRERKAEMAVLKVLGFTPSLIMILVVGEATLVGAVAGLFGSTLAWGCSALSAHKSMPFPTVAGIFLSYPVRPSSVALGLVLGGLVGFLGSVFPAWTARAVKVSDVFAKIA